jgi:hypothetical protein
MRRLGSATIHLLGRGITVADVEAVARGGSQW